MTWNRVRQVNIHHGSLKRCEYISVPTVLLIDTEQEGFENMYIPKERFRRTYFGVEIVDVVEIQEIAHDLQDDGRNGHCKSDKVHFTYYLANA